MGVIIAIIIIVLVVFAGLTVLITRDDRRKKVIQAQRDKLDREAREFYQKRKKID